MRNPGWRRDEIILALDLYFDTNGGKIDKKDARILQTSYDLQAFSELYPVEKAEKFRNINGVYLKLQNFKSLDKAYSGVGMKGGSKLDAIVYNDFNNDRARLKKTADTIRQVLRSKILKEKIQKIEIEETTESTTIIEGEVLYKLHKVRERNKKIVELKKREVLKTTGVLACEVCAFNFENKYGEIGKNFIECHHKSPLHLLSTVRETTIEDLAIVCSNCHRMLHRSKNISTVDTLRKQIIEANFPM